ncbi:MAG TPA: hypothetical protein DEP57_10265 [Selenomonas sp.]|nr:YbjN domain-containing protein [Selenomonadaceae bacterium]HCB94168.1 hypothetical protein [Selenomonas sp.]
MPAKKKKTGGVENNEKALKFRDFIMDNDINVFSTETIDDDYNTVVFRSRIEARGQLLPMAIFIDTSVFTIIRTQVASGIAKSKIQKLEEYLNDLNSRYKIFKYYLSQNGSIYLDICLPFVDETFDSKMVQLMLRILVEHLEEIYEDLMAQVWAKDYKPAGPVAEQAAE